MPTNDYHQDNRKSWNAATEQHHSHKPDLIARYQKGWNNLHPDDMQLLGDLTGQRVVHLQCNDGQDTVSIAKFCGGDVTGIDISDYAIESARKLSKEANIPATFVRSDIFEWFEQNETPFDVVFTSYGAVGWIADVQQWARGIAKSLKRGGRFVMIEFHPLINMYEIDWSLQYDYMGGKCITDGGVGDYVGDDYEGKFKNPYKAHEFSWGIGDILGALLESGLTLKHFKEYPYNNGWQRFPEMKNVERRFYLPDDKPTMAMMFSIIATKQA
ncbi:MAG: class I SAM-dependent methyltransferase [Anaerolineae bacterium]|nr:class I SAM-dependent methyltransferase [Anaerolineae bacterium]